MHQGGNSQQDRLSGDGPDFEKWEDSDFTLHDSNKSSAYFRTLHKFLELIKSSDCVMELLGVVALAAVAMKTELEWVGIASVICIPVLICFSALLKFLTEANNGRKDTG
ncbi:hypothetical protein [Gimesia sp.]|uniref:hypothetical protein n=1 Tax=Gimesia sp. TaxID=2024833 RepID=UPI000C4F21CA|nr:hypothetical protein [Gimesia sp.]MAX40974.1 hypothetical protein [Gimesia sp.]HAH46844.1 hypothetical protein [Planctomycetaceae bacterium]HBL42745.1 hypothetical protein [Planctomycetaceae bacterium]|tara:strand:+ start:3479 stop:3805 length:327 start_codon:yes stop_codon:yes gene_type:complete